MLHYTFTYKSGSYMLPHLGSDFVSQLYVVVCCGVFKTVRVRQFWHPEMSVVSDCLQFYGYIKTVFPTRIVLSLLFNM